MFGHGLPGRLLVASMMALAIVGPMAMPVQAATRVSIVYQAVPVPRSISLCVGETKEITVSILRTVTRNGHKIPMFIPGGYILGNIQDNSIGEFAPTDVGRNIVALGQRPRASFDFVAQKPGRTKIQFIIRTTGDENTIGTGFPTRAGYVDVDVSGCYEAYTSGLASIFVQKTIGNFDHYFVITGYTPNQHGVETETQIMFFLPSRRDPAAGSYAFIDLATTIVPGLTSKCVLFMSGRYKVEYYIQPGQPVPSGADVGDINMYGTGQVFCQGKLVLTLNYTGAPGFRIAFRPAPPP
jgi:hypothetical protein